MAIQRSYTERQVLRKLGIPDFRSLSKEKIMDFVSMYPHISPDVAKKAIEQFPNFASTVSDVLKEYKSVIEEAFEDDRESAKYVYGIYNRIMDSMERMLDEDDLSFEEKMYVIDQMKDIADAIDKKDTERAERRQKVLAALGGVAIFVTGALAAALGGNISLNRSGFSDDEEDIFSEDH